MNKETMDVAKVLEQSKGAHVFYYSNELEHYVRNAVSYIVSGIEQGDHVLFVENDRIYPMILKELDQMLTKEQLENIHFVNNFTFYWENGNFHPPTILSYFSRIAKPYVENDLTFRTWGHIEWRDEEDIVRDIEEYEQELDQMIADQQAVSVCAYDAHRVSDLLKTKLMSCHDLLMTDDEIISLLGD